MNMRELLLVLLILIQLSLNQSLLLTSFDIESLEDLKNFFLNRTSHISTDASSFRYAVCGLTRANAIVTVNWKWMTELVAYNISAYIMHDNDYNQVSENKNITSISISHQLTMHAGYNRGGNRYYHDRIIENGELILGNNTIPNSWDKAIFYFSAIDQHYDFVWLIEDDVYISSVSTFMAVHEQSLNCSTDLTVREAIKHPIDLRKRYMAHTVQPWYRSLVVAVGVSKRLLFLIRTFVEKYDVLEYVEFMFTTIAKQNNLTIFHPIQFQSLLSPGSKHPCYDFITDNDSWYHPIKYNVCRNDSYITNYDFLNLSLILSTGLYIQQYNSSYNADNASNVSKIPGPMMMLDVSLNSISIHPLNSFNKGKYSTMEGNINAPSTWLPMNKASMMEIRSDWITSFTLEFKLVSSWMKIGFIVYNHEVQFSSFISSTSNDNISHSTMSSRYLEVMSRSIREEAVCLRSTGASLVMLVRYGYLPKKLYSYFHGTISREVDVMIIMEQMQDGSSSREYSARNYCHTRYRRNGSNKNESNDMLVSHTIYQSSEVSSLGVIDISTEGGRVHLTRDRITIANCTITTCNLTRNCSHD
jgi:hypothetical protein